MPSIKSIVNSMRRYQTLYTHRISALPIVVLMPHSACNCRCVMCDIWKGNKNAKQLTEQDVVSILEALKKLHTKRVIMSGGEALLNRNFFKFCEILKKEDINITLLSTGMTLFQHAEKIVRWVDEVIVSLDGNETLHDEVRNIQGAFAELSRGVKKLKTLRFNLPVKARTVIQNYNFRNWSDIIYAAKQIGLDGISFLPADVSSAAFNRPEPWDTDRIDNVCISKKDLPELQQQLNTIIHKFKSDFESGFIAESPEKLSKIVSYYSAIHNLNDFPFKHCNAPWVSTVIEADGTVRPCFFFDAIGNIHQEPLDHILNKKTSVTLRKQLNIHTNPTCLRCVCSLNLQPRNHQF